MVYRSTRWLQRQSERHHEAKANKAVDAQIRYLRRSSREAAREEGPESLSARAYDRLVAAYNANDVEKVASILTGSRDVENAFEGGGGYYLMHANAVSYVRSHMKRIGKALQVSRSNPTDTDLNSIVVLYRDDNLGLWGIPYEMRRDVGQEPRHLARAGNTKGWIYLGHPGWWGSIPRDDQARIKAFLKDVDLPGHPHEWGYVAELRTPMRHNPRSPRHRNPARHRNPNLAPTRVTVRGVEQWVYPREWEILTAVARKPGIRVAALVHESLPMERSLEALEKQGWITYERETFAPLSGPKVHLTHEGEEVVRTGMNWIKRLGEPRR